MTRDDRRFTKSPRHYQTAGRHVGDVGRETLVPNRSREILFFDATVKMPGHEQLLLRTRPRQLKLSRGDRESGNRCRECWLNGQQKQEQ